jgi:hypothetical protein
MLGSTGDLGEDIDRVLAREREKPKEELERFDVSEV